MPGWAALTLKTLGDAGVTGLDEVILMVRMCEILRFVVGALCSNSMLDAVIERTPVIQQRFDIGV
jgi:hypothetical protein